MPDVNSHYLDHVVQLSETSEVEASEDILTPEGTKLLAKGARIDARSRERLLQFRLAKPLETLMQVAGGFGLPDLLAAADRLFQQHALLRELQAQVPGLRPISMLGEATLSRSVLSVLNIYAGREGTRLEHAVGVALLSLLLGSGLSANPADINALVVAGLTHDVGELYIEPIRATRGVALGPRQWREMATHPIVGSHVLAVLPGAGPRVAAAVLQHHERLDSFGYPQGALAGGMTMPGQVLALAEMLMGLLEGGPHGDVRVEVAMKLAPGAYDRSLVDRVAGAAQGVRTTQEAGEDASAADPRELNARIRHLSSLLENLLTLRESLEPDLRQAPSQLRALLAHVFDRWSRLRIAFSSTGLHAWPVEDLGPVLAQMSARELVEVGMVAREVQWLLVRLEGQLQIHRDRLEGPVAQRVVELIESARQVPG